MHELAVTESLRDLALRHAAAAGGVRVTDLYLVIGRLSSVVDESVQFYWDIISQGTPAEGARLHFRFVPVTMHCLDCQTDYQPAGDDLGCPTCGGPHVRVMAGEEFFLEAIDVADAGDEVDERSSPSAAAAGNATGDQP